MIMYERFVSTVRFGQGVRVGEEGRGGQRGVCRARTSFCATPSLSYFFMNTIEYDFGLLVLPL